MQSQKTLWHITCNKISNRYVCIWGQKLSSIGCNLTLFIETVFSYLVPFILRSSLPGSEAPLHHHFCRQQHLMAVTHLTDTSPPHIFQSLHSWKEDCVFREKEGLKMPSLSKTWPFLSTCTAEAHPVAFTSSCLDLCTLSRYDKCSIALCFHRAYCCMGHPSALLL